MPPEEVDAALSACDPKSIEALKFAYERVLVYHRRQAPDDVSFTDALGVELGWRWRPIESVGLYVPGGAASYPSSVLMNAAPATVAGCKRIAMVVPTPGGKLNPLVLAAARIAGVEEIYRVGGAQAVAALAYGTETIRPVAKIVGPGNAYVAAAKRRVFGVVGIDMIAGPSEVVVIADGSADPRYVAADLLAQAEHDEAAQSILITDDMQLARNVGEEVMKQLAVLPRQKIAGASWRDYGAVILVKDLAAAIPLVDRLAPEHLEIMARDADALARGRRQRRRDLPRTLYARGDRRLRRRLEPCAAHLALGAFFFGPRGQRLRQAHFHPQMRRARAPRHRPGGGDARRGRIAHGARALGRHPPRRPRKGRRLTNASRKRLYEVRARRGDSAARVGQRRPRARGRDL